MVYCVRGQNFLKYVNLLKGSSGFVAARFARLQTVREGFVVIRLQTVREVLGILMWDVWQREMNKINNISSRALRNYPVDARLVGLVDYFNYLFVIVFVVYKVNLIGVDN